MGLSHSPRIVTGGLVLALDAGSPKSVAPVGQQTYTSSGTYNWTCPAGVTSVSVVCVGGGGGGGGRGTHVSNGSPAQGGYGGGLGYKNNISVTPGQSYTVVIGGGGSGGSNTTSGYSGGDSYFINATIVKGGGGPGGLIGSDSSVGSYQTAAGYVGDGGGNGGRGGRGNQSDINLNNVSGGGGGAGGYSGNGGDGGDATSSTHNSGAAGSGGGGGGGSSADYNGGYRIGAGGGGGVGLLGEGSSGGATSTPNRSGTYGGKGGSGGSDAADNPWVTGDTYLSGSDGALYGGGGGGHGLSYGARSGAGGAVRIMWGSGRSYPSTNTTDQSPSTTWTDLSGKGNTGTINGATHTSGVGGYFDFDGSNGYISHSNDSFVSNGGATLECWFNADTGSVLKSLINHSGYTYYNLIRDSNNKIRLEYKSTSQNNTQLFSSSTISTGIWYHVVSVVDNTGARIYINGELDASNSTPQNLGTVSSTLYIGGYSSSSTYRFDGKIAVAKRYDEPLTAAEVAQNYNALRGRYGI